MNTSNVPGGNDPVAGGDPADKSDKINDPEVKVEDKVSRETYLRTVDQVKKLSGKVAEFERAKKEAEEKALVETNNYKTLYEGTQKALLEKEQELSALTGSLQAAMKKAAIKKHLSGDLEEQYEDLFDLDKVAVDPGTGYPDLASVKAYAKDFESRYSKVISKPVTSKIPSDAPKGAGTGMSYEEWLNLPPAEQKKNMAAVMHSVKKA